MPDYITALAAGQFSEQALAGITSLGFDADRAARTAVLPVGGRLQKAKDTWRLITGAPAIRKGSYIQRVVNFGLAIEWDNRLPGVPHDGRNLPASEDSKAILDTEVNNMLRKNVIRLADTSIPGVILGYFARPKKAAGKFCPIVCLKFTKSFITYREFRITTTVEIGRWIRKDYYFTSNDLSDAYFVIPLREKEARYTRFCWRGIIYEYLTVMF